MPNANAYWAVVFARHCCEAQKNKGKDDTNPNQVF